MSNYHSWNQKEHADDWVLYPENVGPMLSLDETALSKGELYTIITNKSAKGKKGALVAMIKGTKAEVVQSILLKLPRRVRYKVKEITLDMAANMEKIARLCFPSALLVTDRFHVQKLAYDALQEMRIKYRWEALDQENEMIGMSKSHGVDYNPHIYENGDTRKQLLARSRYLLCKKESSWSRSQKHRAEILFREYPNIKKAYYLAQHLGLIYHQCKSKETALTRLAHWYEAVEQSGFKTFNTVLKSIQSNYHNIVQFFNNRSTNASAESFNAKIKSFRASLRGVRDINFFIYRLTKIYA